MSLTVQQARARIVAAVTARPGLRISQIMEMSGAAYIDVAEAIRGGVIVPVEARSVARYYAKEVSKDEARVQAVRMS